MYHVSCSQFMKIELPLDGSKAGKLRKESETVFKSRFLLEILLVMAQESRFYHGQIQKLVPDAGPGFITNVLRRYEEAGLIRYVPVEPGQARRPMEKARSDDPLWTLVPDWAGFLLEDESASVSRLTAAPGPDA